MDDAERFVLLFVFITNALMIFGLMYTFYRVTTNSEETRTMLTLASADLIEAGRGLKGLGDGVDRLIERLSAAERHAAALLKAQPEAPVATMDPELEARLLAALQQPAARAAGGRDTEAHARLDLILQRLDALGTPAAADPNASPDAEVLAWRTRFEQQQIQARMAEERAQATEASAQQLAQELVQVQKKLLRLENGAAPLPDSAVAELETTRNDLSATREELARTAETLQRMQIEKDFIEDRFISLDASTPMPDATAPTAQADAAAAAAKADAARSAEDATPQAQPA